MAVLKWKNVYWRGPGNSIAETTLFDTKEEALRDSSQGFLAYRETLAVHVQEDTMFEVGKKYQSNKESLPLECVWTNGLVACMVSNVGVTLRYKEDFRRYTEYKEPIKHVRYFNVYRDHVSNVQLNSREMADNSAVSGRIGCVRVEFTEGQYDD